jgi:membrane protein involved in colicin uptake
MKAIKLSLILLGAFVMLSCGPSAEEKAAAEKAAAEKIATEKAAADKAAADKAEAERLEQSKKLDADARAKVAMFAPLADLSTLTDVEQAQVSLGQKLYHEKRISKNQDSWAQGATRW